MLLAYYLGDGLSLTFVGLGIKKTAGGEPTVLCLVVSGRLSEFEHGLRLQCLPVEDLDLVPRHPDQALVGQLAQGAV
jgi:hypothetical protein